jgi:hypothetical protein
MIDTKKEYSENNLYADNLLSLVYRSENYIKNIPEPEVWENSWFYDFIPYQTNEEVRLCAVLPMIKLQLKQNCITAHMLEELIIYYEDVIINNDFDKVLSDDEERKMVKADLVQCYETAKQKGLI